MPLSNEYNPLNELGAGSWSQLSKVATSLTDLLNCSPRTIPPELESRIRRLLVPVSGLISEHQWRIICSPISTLKACLLSSYNYQLGLWWWVQRLVCSFTSFNSSNWHGYRTTYSRNAVSYSVVGGPLGLLSKLAVL